MCSGVGVESGSEFAALHVELLSDNGRGELHIKCLIADGEVFGVACYDRTHHMFPPMYEAVFIEWRFETLLAQVLTDKVADGFGIGAAHVNLGVWEFRSQGGQTILELTGKSSTLPLATV